MSATVVTTRGSDMSGTQRMTRSDGSALGTSGWLLVASAGLVLVGNALIGVPCGLRVAAGQHCALCGGTRAAGALLHGDVPGALRMNVVVTAGLLAAVVVAAAAMFDARTRASVDRALAWAIGPGASRLIMGLLVWTVVRNLPAVEVLRPPT